VVLLQFSGDMRYRIILLATTLAACGCGGGEDPIIRDSTFLPVYRYQIEQDRDSEDQLELSVRWDGIQYVFAVRFSGPYGLTGLYDRSSGVTSIVPDSELTVETSYASPLIGAFRALVIEEIATMPTGEFSAGAWMIVAGNDTVRIDVASGTGGVALSLNGGTAVSFEWPKFAELFAPGSAAPTWQQAASASFHVLRIAALQARTAFAALVDATRVSFTNTPDVRSCSMFPGAPPPDVLNTGERVLTWLGSADLGFDLRFTDCWVDLAGEDQDYLYHGEIALTGWRSSGDGSNRLIFVGFGGDEFGNRVPGGVSYLDLDFARTVPNSAGGSDFDPAADYTLSGGFAIGFVQP
jgi:hypothetical protein